MSLRAGGAEGPAGAGVAAHASAARGPGRVRVAHRGRRRERRRRDPDRVAHRRRRLCALAHTLWLCLSRRSTLLVHSAALVFDPIGRVCGRGGGWHLNVHRGLLILGSCGAH